MIDGDEAACAEVGKVAARCGGEQNLQGICMDVQLRLPLVMFVPVCSCPLFKCGQWLLCGGAWHAAVGEIRNPSYVCSYN